MQPFSNEWENWHGSGPADDSLLECLGIQPIDNPQTVDIPPLNPSSENKSAHSAGQIQDSPTTAVPPPYHSQSAYKQTSLAHTPFTNLLASTDASIQNSVQFKNENISSVLHK